MIPRSKVVALGVFCLIVMFGMVGTQAQALKLGVFDAQKVFEETAAGAKVQARLNALEASKRTQLETMQQALQALQQQLLTTGASLSSDKLRDLRLEIDRDTIDLEGKQKAASREFQMEVERAQNEWQDKMIGLVQTYGRDNGFVLIVPLNVVVYFAPGIDITQDLIKLVDAGTPAGS